MEQPFLTIFRNRANYVYGYSNSSAKNHRFSTSRIERSAYGALGRIALTSGQVAP